MPILDEPQREAPPEPAGRAGDEDSQYFSFISLIKTGPFASPASQ